jgi:general stress protein CsbA
MHLVPILLVLLFKIFTLQYFVRARLSCVWTAVLKAVHVSNFLPFTSPAVCLACGNFVARYPEECWQLSV